MNCLIIGYGSIGSRHARILKEMGHEVHVVSKRNADKLLTYKTIEEALDNNDFSYVIISNETSEHYNSFVRVNELGYSGILLIEKPVFSEYYPLPQESFKNVFVGYNLRFHPVFLKLRKLLQDREIYSIQTYVGQYLPDWRPETDYTKCYSAFKTRGGGVLRDLSHELDYLNVLTGGWKCLTARGGTFGDLNINSDDVFCVFMETKRCPIVVVQMNYLDRRARREILINYKGGSLKADIVANTLKINNGYKHYDIEKNYTYIKQHQAILDGVTGMACTLSEGLDTLALIQQIELASEKRIWIEKKDRI